MSLFRFATLAISMGLMIAPAQANTEPSTPPSLTDSHTLNLRAASSRLVVDTIEDALRQGGNALFDEGFQIDSSLNWVFGENIEGEIDAVVPLWSGGGHAVFAQPGFVSWTGLADEERIDGNLGIAYRTGLAEDVIGGASIFYDRDFKQGHSRISLGADVQSGFFHGATNYYQPLSDEEDGREGFVEEALRGMDFRFAVQRDIMRASANLGYWRFEGDDSVEADWKISYGMDAGIRVFPGVFIEGGWEHHDEDVSLDSRWNAGLAFRFSLPDFKGASYGDGSMSSNLYQIVEREKRILYEERVKGPSVTIARAQRESGNLREDNDEPASIQIRLSEALEEDVVLNLVGSGTATYGASADYQVSVVGTACNAVTMENCQVTIPMGSTSADVMVIAREDGGSEPAETIILSVAIASAGNTGLMLGSPSSLTLTIDADPTAGFVLSSSTVEEPETGTIEHRIAVSLSASPTAIVVLDASFDTEDSGAEITDDYNSSDQQRRVVFAADATGDDLVQEVVLTINADEEVESDETIVLTLTDSNDSLTSNGNNFTIENARHIVTILDNDEPNTINFNRQMLTLPEDDGGVLANFAAFSINLSSPLPTSANININFGGNAEDGDYLIEISENDKATGSAYANGVLTIGANDTRIAMIATANQDTDDENETITLTLGSLPSGWIVADPSTLTIRITDDDRSATTPAGRNTIGFFGPSMVNIAEGDNAALEVVLKDSSGTALTTSGSEAIPIAYTFSSTTDISASSGTHTISANTTLTEGKEALDMFSITRDSTVEEREEFTVTLTMGTNFPSTNWEIDSSASEVTYIIAADDNSVGFSAPTAEIRETGQQSTTATININRPNASEIMYVVLRFSTTDANPATFTLDYTWMLSSNVTRGSGGVVTIPAGTTSFTITVTAIDDDPIPDNRETVTLLLSESSSNPLPSGWELGTTEHRITILEPEL